MAKRQIEIVGAARDSDKAIDEVVERYVTAMYKWRELRVKMSAAKDDLDAVMKEKKKKVYVYIDGEYKFTVTVKDDHKLTVKREELKEEE